MREGEERTKKRIIVFPFRVSFSFLSTVTQEKSLIYLLFFYFLFLSSLRVEYAAEVSERGERREGRGGRREGRREGRDLLLRIQLDAFGDEGRLR